MGQLWFYGQSNQKLGPYTAPQLRELAVAGKILITDTVWKNGIDLGVLADKVKNLFPIPALVPLLDAILVPLMPSGLEKQVMLEPGFSGAATVVPITSANAEAAAEILRIIVPKPTPLPNTPKALVKKMRALAIRGAKITGQDGATMQFRKTCTSCGHEDPSRTSMVIRPGKIRIIFYCPKCRKPREVEIQGMN